MRLSSRGAAIARITTVAAVALGATTLFTAQASASTASAGGAVFVQTDGVTSNAVVVYDRDADGTLHQAGTYDTGGRGGVLAGAVVDNTASQGAVVYDRTQQLLYVVNAGSDSLTVFSVNGDTLIRRQVVSTGGSFPVSVAVHGNLVYILNARDGGSIQGFVRIGEGLIRVPSWQRPLGLDPTLAPEFTHTPGQIAFTPDGSQLVVTTKANGDHIDVFGVSLLGRPSLHPVVNTKPGSVPFAVAFDAGGHLVVAETGTGAVVTYTLHANGTITTIDTALTGQAATCWVTTDGVHFYASNAGSANVSGYTDEGDGTLTALGNTATDAGTVDATATADGRFLYVQAGAAGIIDGYRIAADGTLTPVGSVTVPHAVGAEGIAAS